MRQGVITAAYAGWMAFIAVNLFKAFPPGNVKGTFGQHSGQFQGTLSTKAAVLLVGAVFVLLYHRLAPPLFYAYFALPIGLWSEVLRQQQVILLICMKPMPGVG
jgi:hypothetical protein